MKPPVNIMSAKQATGAGETILIAGFKTKYLQVSCEGVLESAVDTITVKIKASSSDKAPDFSAASSSTNFWSYPRITNKDDNSAVAGSTGMTFTNGGTFDIGNYTMNVEAEGFKWLTAEITTYTDVDKTASITISCILSDIIDD